MKGKNWIENFDIFESRFFPRYVKLLPFVLIFLLFQNHYFPAQSPMRIISFLGADGWCEPNYEGVGVHCFGDFWGVIRLVSEVNPWANSFGVPISYTPLAMAYFLPFEILYSNGLNPRFVLSIYLASLAVAVAAPAWFLLRSSKLSFSDQLYTLGIILTSAGVLISIDRGNNAVLTFPFLFLFLLGELKENRKMSLISLFVAIMLRPQMLAFLLLLVWQRRYRDTFLSILFALLGYILCAAMWSGTTADVLKSWVSNLSTYTQYSLPSTLELNNLSLVHGVSVGLQVIDSQLFTSPYVSTWIRLVDLNNASIGYIFGVCVALLTVILHERLTFGKVVVIATFLTVLVPSVTFAYYLFIVLILVCLPQIYKFSKDFDEPNRDLYGLRDSQLFSFFFVFTLLLATLPLSLPLSFLIDKPAAELAALSFGLLPLFMAITVLLMFIPKSLSKTLPRFLRRKVEADRYHDLRK